MSARPEPSRRRWLVLVSAVVSFFAVGVTFFAVPPLVPQLTDMFGLNHLQIGILMGAIAIPAVFVSIPLGSAIDRWPARAAGTVGLSVMTAGAAIFALAPGYIALLAGRIVFGIGGLIVNLLLARLVTAAFQGRELSLAMGIFNAVYPSSMIVMFTAHPAVLALAGWRGELILLAGLAVLALPLHLWAIPKAVPWDDDPPEPQETRHRVSPALATLAAVWALFFSAYAAVLTFAPEWAGGGDAALRTVSLIAWTALVFAPPVGAAIDRVGHPSRWLSVSLVLLGATLICMSLDAIHPVPAMILVGFSAASALTATYTLPGRLVPAANVGFAFGFITAFSNLATLVGPSVTGAIKDNATGWRVPWAVLAVTVLAGAVAAVKIRPHGPDAQRSSTAQEI